jgi:predicted N-acetyltransferase YhbS
VSETFRPARPDEIDDVARLEAHSFPAPDRGHEWWEDFLLNGPHGGIEALWAAEERGRLVGACQLLWMRQWIGGVSMPVMGLGSVAIAPTHRKRGLATRLLIAGFEHARERGDVGSVLYPFRASFYEGLGYGLAGEAHQYQVPPSLLPDDKQERMRVRMVDGEDDEAAMRAIYREAAQRLQTGQLDRTERNWRQSWKRDDLAAVLYWGESGEAEGYAIVRYRADLPIDRRFIELEERVWLSLPAQRGIYAWLSSLGDQWREVVYRAHPEEGFGDRLSEPRLPLLVPQRHPAARADVPGAGRSRRAGPAAAGGELRHDAGAGGAGRADPGKSGAVAGAPGRAPHGGGTVHGRARRRHHAAAGGYAVAHLHRRDRPVAGGGRRPGHHRPAGGHPAAGPGPGRAQAVDVRPVLTRAAG